MAFSSWLLDKSQSNSLDETLTLFLISPVLLTLQIRVNLTDFPMPNDLMSHVPVFLS